VWLYLVDSQPTIIRPIQGASQREGTILENWLGGRQHFENRANMSLRSLHYMYTIKL
jgi:hypothetical protein